MRHASVALPLVGLLLAATGPVAAPTGDGLLARADSLAQAREYDQAEALYLRHLARVDLPGAAPGLPLAEALGRLGNLHQVREEFARAAPYLEREIRVRESAQGPEQPDLAGRLVQIASFYEQWGRYQRAEDLYARALASLQKAYGLRHEATARCLRRLGQLYVRLGPPNEAESHLRQALAIDENLFGREAEVVASDLEVLASLLMDQRQYDKAEAAYLRALGIYERIHDADHLGAVRTKHNLAGLYAHSGRTAEAEALYLETLEAARRAYGDRHTAVARIQHNLARVYGELGCYFEAEQLYLQAIRTREAVFGPNHPQTALYLLNLADLYRAYRKHTEAEPLYRRALSIAEESSGPGHRDVLRAVTRQALLYGAMGQHDASRAAFERSIALRHQFLANAFSASSYAQKARWSRKYPVLYAPLLALAFADSSRETREAALDMVLNGKAVVLDAARDERRVAWCSSDPELERTLARHAELSDSIAALALDGGAELSARAYGDSLQALLARREGIEASISARCKRFAGRRTLRKVSSRDVAAGLPPDAVLWELVRLAPYDFGASGTDEDRLGPARYVAFTLVASGRSTLVDLGDAAAIDALVEEARRRIREAATEVYSPRERALEEALRQVTEELSTRIVAPLLASGGSRPDVFISPDGALSLLPFEVLPDVDGRYFIESHTVSYLSSGRDLVAHSSTAGQGERTDSRAAPATRRGAPATSRGDGAVVLGDVDYDARAAGDGTPRPEAEVIAASLAWPVDVGRAAADCPAPQFAALRYGAHELEAIAHALREQGRFEVRVYRGPAASERSLRREAGPRILHVATHGYFCGASAAATDTFAEDPLLRSGLVLAGANLLHADSTDGGAPDDGILTALEISSLNLVGTRLAVLSACESGVGDVVDGEGVVGLRRAFHHAGAQSVLMSLWQVPDKETTQLMVDFYQGWLEGRTRRAALRQAALHILQERRASRGAAHPFFWGGFVLDGGPGE